MILFYCMIKKINLTNIRNHNNLSLDLNDRFIYIKGPNGSGKTTILESIYLTSTTKSHRTNNDFDLVKRNEKFGIIHLETNKDIFKIVIHEKGKSILINNKEAKKLSEVIGRLKVIMFSPEDLNLIKGSPHVRRSFIDYEIIKYSKNYLNNLTTYKNILKQRNALLKNISLNDDQTFLNILGTKLYEIGIKIIRQRSEFIEELNLETKKIYSLFSDKNIEINYLPNAKEEIFLNHLTNNQKQDILYKTTMSGPHRDDFLVTFMNEDAYKSSQGEIRLIVISMKLGLINVLKNKTSDNITLLLDDVLSELDDKIKHKFLDNLPDNMQIILNSAINIDSNNVKILELKGEM